MAQTVEINESLLYPGDTIRLDFAIPGNNEMMVTETIASIKKSVYSDDRFDYQGSKVQPLYDTEAQREVQMLSIFVTVRKERREARSPIEYASLSNLEALIRSAPEALGFGVKHLRSQIGRAIERAGDALSKVGQAIMPTSVVVLLILVFAYAILFGVPQRD